MKALFFLTDFFYFHQPRILLNRNELLMAHEVASFMERKKNYSLKHSASNELKRLLQ